jgi:hypothetical protein
MPCSPNDVSINTPSGPSGPAIPGFGVPFSLPAPSVSPFPPGFPEDLLSILNKLQLLIPPGALKPQLNPNFGKDVFDGIMKLLDQFMPFLMLYKFFLPILNIIICIIEVLCALMNPFALISAINRLFNQCIPEFLNIFPVFALIIMIISLLLLILALIEYIVAQILKIVQALLRNIVALNNAFQNGDASGILAIAKKLGSLLCIFQNLFVLFAIFNIIIDIIRDILRLAFAIPPCQDGQSGDVNSCCTPETCPAIVKSQYTRHTGTFKYFPEIGGRTTFAGFPSNFAFTFSSRNELWQLYDIQQSPTQAFRNIFDATDITQVHPKPVFFPSGTTYGVGSDLRQVPYLVDMRVFYNPRSWGRPGIPRFVRFDNCIITVLPTTNLVEADLTTQGVSNAVAVLVGGAGFEDNNTTPLQAYASDGVTPISGTADLNNFFHMPPTFNTGNNFIEPRFNDGYTFLNVEYTFKPNMAPLIQRNLVTLGCSPDVAFSKGFISNIFASDIALKTQLLGDLVNNRNGNTFPDPNGAQQCMLAAIAALRSNMTAEGVAIFEATTSLCLGKLRDDTNGALNNLIGIGIDPCSSTFSITPSVQFTSEPVVVSVSINERNSLPLTNGLPPSVAANIAARLSAHASFGNVSDFAYDGYQAFTAQLTSPTPGSGQISLSFDNNIFCSNTFSPPNHTLQSQGYQFIYTPVFGAIPVPQSAEGDTSDGKPRRDGGDVARDGNDSGGKGGS